MVGILSDVTRTTCSLVLSCRKKVFKVHHSSLLFFKWLVNSTKLVTIDIRSDRQSGWYQFLAFQFSIHLLHNNTFCIWNLDLVVCGTASWLTNNDAIFWNCCTTAISHHRLSRRQDMVSFDGGCSNTKQMFRCLSFWAGVSWWGMHLLSLYTFRIQCKYKRIVSSLHWEKKYVAFT